MGTWCVGGIESKPDTLDVLLYNEVVKQVMNEVDEGDDSDDEKGN